MKNRMLKQSPWLLTLALTLGPTLRPPGLEPDRSTDRMWKFMQDWEGFYPEAEPAAPSGSRKLVRKSGQRWRQWRDGAEARPY
jgi:hypothetical protein